MSAQCDTPTDSPRLLEQHMVICPAIGESAYMHADLISCIEGIVSDARVPRSAILKEPTRLQDKEDMLRPRDVAVLNLYR
jgi:hypothetical protein